MVAGATWGGLDRSDTGISPASRRLAPDKVPAAGEIGKPRAGPCGHHQKRRWGMASEAVQRVQGIRRSNAGQPIPSRKPNGRGERKRAVIAEQR